LTSDSLLGCRAERRVLLYVQIVHTRWPQAAREVRVSGAKNARYHLASSFAGQRPFHLRNVPDLGDVTTMKKLLRQLGPRWT